MIQTITITAMVIKVMTIQVIVLPIAVMIQMLRQPLTILNPVSKAALIQSQLLIILNKVVVEMMKVAVAVDFQRNLLLAVLNNLFYFF